MTIFLHPYYYSIRQVCNVLFDLPSEEICRCGTDAKKNVLQSYRERGLGIVCDAY